MAKPVPTATPVKVAPAGVAPAITRSEKNPPAAPTTPSRTLLGGGNNTALTERSHRLEVLAPQLEGVGEAATIRTYSPAPEVSPLKRVAELEPPKAKSEEAEPAK